MPPRTPLTSIYLTLHSGALLGEQNENKQCHLKNCLQDTMDPCSTQPDESAGVQKNPVTFFWIHFSCVVKSNALIVKVIVNILCRISIGIIRKFEKLNYAISQNLS